MITISAVITCYNRENTIAEAVASVSAQTRAPLETIVVDDASTDDSVRVAERAGARVVRMPVNRGSAGARNEGIRAASGDAIAWLDSDDYWEPNHLEIVAGLLDRYPEAGVASSAVRRVGAASGTWYCSVPDGPPSDVFRKAFNDWIIPSITTITRRDAIIAAGCFDESERFAVDFDAWLRLARRYRFVASREVTANWRWHDAQLSGSLDLQLEATYRSRSNMLRSITNAGDNELASELSTLFRARWERDVQQAWDDEKTSWLRGLVELAPLVPGLPRPLVRKWAVRSRIPHRLVSVLRAYRGRGKPVAGVNAAR
mgnify:FL=1